MMQESLTSMYNMLLSFIHVYEKVITSNDLGYNLEGVLQFHQRSVYLDWSYTYYFRPRYSYMYNTHIHVWPVFENWRLCLFDISLVLRL